MKNKIQSMPTFLEFLKNIVSIMPRGRMPLLNILYRYFPYGLFWGKWQGIKMIFNFRDRDSWMLYFNKVSERYQTPYFKLFLSSGMKMVDIGANNGYYSLLASTLVDKIDIYAFEANPILVEQLEIVVNENQLKDKIKIVSCAVSDKNGIEKFDFSNASHQGTGHIVLNELKEELVPVKSITMDSWMNDNRIDYVDIMKVDVEGAEMNVLKGMEYHLKSQAIGVLFIEVHNDLLPLFGTSSSALFAFLKSQEYVVKVLPSEFEILKGDRYNPKIENIPVFDLEKLDSRTDNWWHCIAFSKEKYIHYESLLTYTN
ncbi:FkbM family methyltransferase [Runella zeae]|uniref:FkbM family methyltransferase n=1 Tax=Runella zeae TaxID=94255 RepID=UPI0004223351|nr:FkbM family methyltransferase [Runella zeae]